MIDNRSMPHATVIPVLAYRDVIEAADWLCAAFGFEVRLRIANHRVQLVFGDGAVIATDGGGPGGAAGHSVLMRVEDADRHHDQAAAAGARLLKPPPHHPHGGRPETAR